jgi:glycogen debranching enzyme
LGDSLKITHSYTENNLSREIDDDSEISFCLSDKRGSYFSLGAKNNVSFYQGMHFPVLNEGGWQLYKIIENIFLQNSQVSELKNNYHDVERIGTSFEKFTMPFEQTLLYEVSHCDSSIVLELDAREIYDFSGEGRIYEVIEKDKNTIVVKYTKYNNNNQDEEQYTLFLAIKFLDKNLSYEKIDKWEGREYSYDNSRSHSQTRYIYQALKFNLTKGDSSRILFTAAENEEELFEILGNASNNLKSIVSFHKKHYMKFYGFKKLKKNIPDDIYMAYIANIKSLDDLIVLIRKHLGIYAGFYWFFQFWSRDEAISLKSLILLEKYSLVKTILMRESSKILDDGRIPNRFPHSDLGSSDGVGWCFFRFYELIRYLENKAKLDVYVTSHDIHVMKERLLKSLELLEQNHTHDNLAISGKKETWMDTSPDDCDNREGACIEVQALRLSMYKLAQKLSKLSSDKENVDKFASLENDMKKAVKEKFFQDGKLGDRFNPNNNELDLTQRPNIFLAYYIYPELLEEDEWKSAFDFALEKLWLDWGAVTTIDKNHNLFRNDYTGEENWSYHRGDSWYFVNNIAAISMYRLDKAKYMDTINSIIKSSMEETLFSGIIGANAEVSSAKELQSKGTWQQAWSCATFIELIKEVWGKGG